MSLSFLLGLVLVLPVAATAADPGDACVLDHFKIVGGLDDGKATPGKEVTFEIGFGNSNARSGSVQIDYGDGTAEDTGLRTFNLWWFGTAHYATLRLNHLYTRPGTFHSSLKGAIAENRPCAYNGRDQWGDPVQSLEGGIQVHVVRSSASATIGKQTESPVKDLAVYEKVGKEKGSLPPVSGQGAKDLGLYESVGKEKGNFAYALSPGHIGGAVVSQSSRGNVLKVEGSGKCGLKVFEELDGKAVEIYDYKGPLPTTIPMVNALPGMHVAKIEGDKSSEACGGTASASFSIARPGRKSRSGQRQP